MALWDCGGVLWSVRVVGLMALVMSGEGIEWLGTCAMPVKLDGELGMGMMVLIACVRLCLSSG